MGTCRLTCALQPLKQLLWRVVPSLSAEASLYSGWSPAAFAQGVSVVAAFSLAASIYRKSLQGRPSRLPCQGRSFLPAELPCRAEGLLAVRRLASKVGTN